MLYRWIGNPEQLQIKLVFQATKGLRSILDRRRKAPGKENPLEVCIFYISIFSSEFLKGRKGVYFLSSRTKCTQGLRQGLQAASSSLRLDSHFGSIWSVMLSALLAGLAGAGQVLPAPQS